MPRRNGAAHTMRDAGERLASGARHSWQQGRSAMHEMDDRLEDSVREHPLGALLAAVGVGIIAGILLTLACPESFPQLKHRS